MPTEPHDASGRARGDLGSFAHGQFAADYEHRPDLARLREARVERVQRLLADSELDALLVWKDENVRYLTGLRAQILSGKSALLNGCLLLADRPPILFVSGGDLERARNTMVWIEELYPIPILEAVGLIRGAFEHTIAPLLRKLALELGAQRRGEATRRRDTHLAAVGAGARGDVAEPFAAGPGQPVLRKDRVQLG